MAATRSILSSTTSCEQGPSSKKRATAHLAHLSVGQAQVKGAGVCRGPEQQTMGRQCKSKRGRKRACACSWGAAASCGQLVPPAAVHAEALQPPLRSAAWAAERVLGSMAGVPSPPPFFLASSALLLVACSKPRHPNQQVQPAGKTSQLTAAALLLGQLCVVAGGVLDGGAAPPQAVRVCRRRQLRLLRQEVVPVDKKAAEELEQHAQPLRGSM